jgi:hypothetical protein
MKYLITKTGRLVYDKINALNPVLYIDEVTGKQYLKVVEGVLGEPISVDNVLRLAGGEPLLLAGGEEILLGPA